MTLRSIGQETGDLGEKLFAYRVAEDRGWICRKLGDDFGIDFELELAEPEVTGHLLRVQVKSSAAVKIEGGCISLQVAVSLLRYAESCRYPVILAVVDTTTRNAWYLWVQEWLMRKEVPIRTLNQATLHLEIPDGNRLELGLRDTLRPIARWQTGLQVTLSLKDCARVASFSGNVKVLSAVARLMSESAGMLDTGVLQVIIRQVISLAEASWRSHEGWELSQALFTFCREAGNLFDVTDIANLVVRESTYSRTGITALGLLYDNFLEHLQPFCLPKYFEQSGDWRIAYYCALREKYPGKKSEEVLFGKTTEFAIGSLTVSLTDRDEWLHKWANRGDSFILERVHSR
jgi:hypothetical protein